MNYKVVGAIKAKTRQTQYGAMDDWTLQLTDEAGQEIVAELSQKGGTEGPTIGQELAGTVEDTQWGKRFKKMRPGAFGGRNEDPARQASIERQNAMTNAINRACKLADIYLSMNKPTEAIEALKPKHLIQVATYLAKYSHGEITIVSESKESTDPFETQPSPKPSPKELMEKGMEDARRPVDYADSPPITEEDLAEFIGEA